MVYALNKSDLLENSEIEEKIETSKSSRQQKMDSSFCKNWTKM